ncbi:MAG: DUF438 domain-containing protein, partial [Planctomycetota bacterium]
MNKHKDVNLAEELTNFLIKLSETKNKNLLREEATNLIESVTPKDFASAEDNLIRIGVTPEKIQELSATFIMMGLLEREK